MDKSISQFKEIYKVSGEEYLLLTYPNISNAKIKLKHIIGSIDFVINGVTKQQMWQLMKAPTDEQINISHLNDALQNYPTIDWVKRQQYLTIEDVDDFVTEAQLNQKQDLLVNGINIKTINGISVLGKGDINTQNIEWRNVLDKPNDIVNISDRLAEKLDTDLYNSDKELFANKSELEDKVDKSEIADMATETWVTQQGFLTEHQDISNLATKTEVVEGLASKQNKGDYALKSDLNDLATKEELSTKQDVLTSGVNIVTINGQSLLNGGNIEIEDNGITDAPTDDKIYGRKNGNWSIIEDNVGKVYQSDIYPNAEIFNDYENNIAFGQYAHAEGRETNATGSRAHAEGYLTKVFAADAHGEGRETWCLGAQGHSEGFYSIAYGANSHVEGCAYGDYSPLTKTILANKDEEFIRTLYDNIDYFLPFTDKSIRINDKFYEDFIFHGSFGERNHVEGVNNSVLCNTSHVEGFNNIVGSSISGHGANKVHHAAHVEGCYNEFLESGEESGVHIEGLYNSVKESSNTKINEDGSSHVTYYDATGSHVEGHRNSIICVKYDESASPQYTYGSAEASHVGGAYCSVELADYAFAHGYHLTVKNKYETSFGKYNASEIDGKKVLFSYGIGLSNRNRKNAISVFEDGSVAIPNLVGFDTDINRKLESLESKLNTFNSQIINIYNKLSNGDITSPVFVLNDTLIITNRINTVITDTDLAINDEMFIFANEDLSYNSNDGYLTKATYENGNLIFESTNE